MELNDRIYFVGNKECRDILLESRIVKGVNSYKYLDVIVTKDGTGVAELKKV